MGCESSKNAKSDEPSLIRQDNAQRSNTFKVVLLGDRAVGKSSIVLRYTQDRFSDAHELTIGAAFVAKDISVPSSGGGITPLKLHIWDTAGEEAYRAMTRFFYREAAAGVIVYDVTSHASFNDIESWIKDFRQQCADAVIVLAGNKVDVPEDQREVTAAKAKAFADANNLIHMECSAKENIGVEDLFRQVGIELLKRGA